MAFIEKSLETIQGIRKYPKMFFFGKHEFENHCDFILGLITGVEAVEDIKLDQSISNWLKKKNEIESSSVFWLNQLVQINKDLSEEENIEKLLDIIEAYLLENPDGF